MSEGAIFLSLAALLALPLSWAMGHFPRAFKGCVMAGALLLVGLMEWSQLHDYPVYPVYEEMGEFHALYPLPMQKQALLPWLVVTAAVPILMLASFLRRVRQRCGALGARMLLIGGFALLPLQMALFMDAFTPVFGGMLGMGFSLLVAGIVVPLLLWQAGVLAQLSHLGGYHRPGRWTGGHTPCRR